MLSRELELLSRRYSFLGPNTKEYYLDYAWNLHKDGQISDEAMTHLLVILDKEDEGQFRTYYRSDGIDARLRVESLRQAREEKNAKE